MNQCKTFLIVSFSLKNTKIFKNTEINEMISNWNACYEKAKGLRENNQMCQVQGGRPTISCMVRDGLSDEVEFQLYLAEEREQAGKRRHIFQTKQVQSFCLQPEYLRCGKVATKWERKWTVHFLPPSEGKF